MLHETEEISETLFFSISMPRIKGPARKNWEKRKYHLNSEKTNFVSIESYSRIRAKIKNIFMTKKNVHKI